MLPKKNRISKDFFEKIFKEGGSFSFKYFLIKKVKISTAESAFTVVVSSKVAKKAVLRNKLKRRMRHIIKKILPSAQKGLGIIVILKKGVEKLDFWEMGKELKDNFQKAGII